MSEIGAGYYKGQDAHISDGDIVAIVMSITFGLPILACLCYVIGVWIWACCHKEEMRRNGTIGTGCFWCWKSSSQVDLSVDELVNSVPAAMSAGKGGTEGGGATRQGSGLDVEALKGGGGGDHSGSSTPTKSDSDGDVELTTSRRPAASTINDAVIQVS